MTAPDWPALIEGLAVLEVRECERFPVIGVRKTNHSLWQHTVWSAAGGFFESGAHHPLDIIAPAEAPNE